MALIRLEQLARPLQDEEPECGLLQLPQELVYLIVSYLPVPSAVSLSLTCKTFKALVHGLGIVLGKTDFKSRAELLATLQQDLPGIYFCYCCYKLRRLKPNADWNGQPHKWTPGPFHPRSWWLSEQSNVWHVPMPYHFPTFKSHFHIDFMEVYLIMNAHFLGPSHGIPLETMQRYVAFQDHIELNICQPSGNHGSHPGDHPRTRQGLVGLSQKNAEEFPRLEGLWRLNGPLVPWQCLARLISSLEPEVCRHMRCSAASSPPFCNLVPMNRGANEAQRSLPGNGLYMVPLCASPESDSCMICNADYDISLIQDTDNNQWAFTLSVYHCLGECRTPRDENWSLFVHDLSGRLGDAVGRLHERARRGVRVSKHAGNARRNWVEGGQSQVVCHGGQEQEIVSLLDD
ncbi:uncharacterized protein TRIREDRAFT_104171 [Trichoderma reesei QM6a]|uniref:Predicted protein n=1 Tax=Hypocrea jecorina (strain QM6a) TaxID=431241 RepID=G0RBM8_HYPJQ|nr:uncharacterized protein TRIREDRAFT_104171 [Trichoderma reesei QM6a]EGR51082.1 predicted protein [Trichoderma reesei QM6a]